MKNKIYLSIIMFFSFNILANDINEDSTNNENNVENQEFLKKDSFKFSETKNNLFNKIDNYLDFKSDICLLNSSYFAETKNLNKYSSLKSDNKFIGKYLSLNNYLGYKIKKDQSIGLRFGAANFGAGNLIQYDITLSLEYIKKFLSIKSFYIEGECGLGFYFKKNSNDKLKIIQNAVEKLEMETFTEKIFVNILFSFYWNFIGLSIGGPIALKFLSSKGDLDDKIEKIVNIVSLALSDTGNSNKDVHDYLKDKINSNFINFLDFLNIRLSLNYLDLVKFILQKVQK